jgi:uncharacterized protein YndB with AHSA1/START domain
MDRPTFVYVTYIATTTEKLWEALTKSKFKTSYWFGMQSESDWQVGSTFTSKNSDGTPVATGQVLECDPPRRLAHTIRFEDPRVRHEPTTRVTYELEPLGKEVRLTVTHDQFEAGSQLFEGVKTFWPKVLSSLKSVLETGVPLDITSPEQANKG